MARHVVVGTAGHVDHGKTALVKALTGVDTDRWEEEKRRGITIDLGFAPLPLADGLHASVVDVPGHEDFVRNMVAGATGVDLALLVIAADEGIMPQTEEHLSILEFLDVKSGVVAITKSDLVEPEWLELVVSEVRERLKRSPIRWEGPVVVSSVTGAGLDSLRTFLVQAAGRARERAVSDLFRLPVDRVFSVAGAGTVVTGTTWSGTVSVGDEVRVLPGEHRARIRSIEVHGIPQETAQPGRRTALALVGLHKSEARRGSVVVADPTWRETRALDVLVTLLPRARPLKQGSTVRLHLGTAEVLARVTPLTEQILPGSCDQPARLTLNEPVCGRWGDRAVLRLASPPTTIGGCLVVDPWPAAKPRRPIHARELGHRDLLARVTAFVAASSRPASVGLDLNDLPVRLGISPPEVSALLERLSEGGLCLAGERIVQAEVMEDVKKAVITILAQYHRDHPTEPGMSLDALRRTVAPASLVEPALGDLVRRGAVALSAGSASLPGHRTQIPEQLAALAQRLGEELQSGGYQGKSLTQLQSLGPPEAVRVVLEYFVRQGTAVRIGSEQYCSWDRLQELVAKVRSEIERLGEATPAQLREPLGLSRKYLIPLLEWMDGQGYTRRHGDARRLGPRAHL